MSRSKKWRLEWSFFLGEHGCRKYNNICKGCAHPRKQSFRAAVVSCLHYPFHPLQKAQELEFKMGEKTACGGFSV